MDPSQAGTVRRELLYVALVHRGELEDRGGGGPRVPRVDAERVELRVGVVVRSISDACRHDGNPARQRLQDRQLGRIAQRRRKADVCSVLHLLDLLPAPALSNGEPRPVSGKPFELLQQDAVAVHLERRPPMAPNLVEDGDGARWILLAEEPPDPDDPDRLLGSEEPRAGRRQVSKRKRNVRRSDAVAAASTRDSGSRKRYRLRQSQHGARDEPLEDGPEEPVVEKRARRERRA